MHKIIIQVIQFELIIKFEGICLNIWKVMILVSLFSCTCITAHADGVYLEGGQGFIHSTDAQVFFLDYQIESRPFFGINSFYSAAIGAWSGKQRNKAVILSKGFWWSLYDTSYFCFEPGGAYVTETTENLGTHPQFSLKFALGMRKDNFDYSLCYRHFSNGAGIFQWTSESNLSENFMMIQVGYLF